MRTLPILALCLTVLASARLMAQTDAEILAHDELVSLPGEEPDAPVDPYEDLVRAAGGDSVRRCQGYACNGWVEDRHPGGQLLHRGYYQDGQLITYRNFFPDGTVEREFKVLDNVKSQLRTYHANEQLRSETRYFNGDPLIHEEHYANGQLRYAEEKHRTEPYYIRMDLYRPDGKPISTLRLVDKRTATLEQAEYWPDGQVRCKGLVRYDPNRMDSERVGEWSYFDNVGQARFVEAYVDGKVHELKPLVTQAR